MKNKNLAFVDIETTGFDLATHEIIELACIIVAQKNGVLGDVVSERDFKIKPENIEKANPEALSVNGYNEADWVFGVDLKQAMQSLSEQARDCIFVAHNVAFDWSFISQAFEKTGIENTFFFQKIDTISFALAKLHKNADITRYNLASLCNYLGISNERPHTALADTQATVEVYRKLLEL